jgi:thiosulfate reductase cytochrome b subunit
MAPEWLTHTFWTQATAPHPLYHWFNLAECLFWLVCAAVVGRRWWARRYPLELAYALSFVAFALSDLREAYALQAWLILAKAANVVLLLGLRARLRPRYPGQALLP